ncbi:MAG: hypothetical protein IT385_27590 [Deltaproteobacteria bacterium]|nr:hypothetical protein [Deltaproteobacteria bacterium]
MRVAHALVAPALVTFAWLGACAGESAAPPGEGAPCDAVTPCAGERLCVDGLCVARPTPPTRDWREGGEPVAPAAWLDIVGSDATADVVAHDDADGTDAATEAEVASELRLVLGPHDALAEPADTRLGLVSGQGAAREVIVPAAAEAVAIDVVLRAPDGIATACGRYEVALWAPDAGGAFPVAPTWLSAPRAIATTDDVVRVALPERPPVEAGRLRFGLVFRGACEASFAPWIGLDASGDTGDSWVWADVWIPGAALDLEGRWGLSLVIGL